MGKKAQNRRRRSDKRPEAENIWVPVAVPSPSGKSELQAGQASMQRGMMVIKFSESVTGVAIQRMFERGAVLGLQFVMLEADDKNQEMQDKLIQEAKDREDLNLLAEEHSADPEEPVEENPVLAQAQEIIDGVSVEIEEPGVTVDQVVSEEAIAGLATEGYDVPVFLGEPGEEDRPQVGWAKMHDDGTAEVVWDGEPPFDMGAKVITNISEDDISIFAASDEQNDNKEKN